MPLALRFRPTAFGLLSVAYPSAVRTSSEPQSNSRSLRPEAQGSKAGRTSASSVESSNRRRLPLTVQTDPPWLHSNAHPNGDGDPLPSPFFRPSRSDPLCGPENPFRHENRQGGSTSYRGRLRDPEQDR